MRAVAVLLLVVFAGCTGRTFTHLGHGVGVPTESIERYAEQHGVTRAEARTQLRKETDEDRMSEHTAK